jgi:spore coat protein U-like protein
MKRTILIAVAVAALVFGVVAYANAATSGTVTVSATVRPQMEITVPATVDLGTVDPNTPASGTVTVTGKSNKNATLSASVDPGTFTTLSSAAAAPTPIAWGKGGNLSYADTVTGTVDWSIDAGTVVSGQVTYTIAQP